MFQIIPDNALFRHAYGILGGYGDFHTAVSDAVDAGIVAMLNAEIARIAGDINHHLISLSRHEPKKITMAEYLSEQKVIIPIAQRYMNLVAYPISERQVAEHLQKWGFEPRLVGVYFKKRRLFLSRQCQLEITFARK